MDIAVNTATHLLPSPDTNAPFPELLLTGLGLGFTADKQADSWRVRFVQAASCRALSCKWLNVKPCLKKLLTCKATFPRVCGTEAVAPCSPLVSTVLFHDGGEKKVKLMDPPMTSPVFLPNIKPNSSWLKIVLSSFHLWN